LLRFPDSSAHSLPEFLVRKRLAGHEDAGQALVNDERIDGIGNAAMRLFMAGKCG
jgi:hypothetical protein